MISRTLCVVCVKKTKLQTKLRTFDHGEYELR